MKLIITLLITYNINLGERGKIKKIDFIGNKVFKNNKLRNIIIQKKPSLEVYNKKQIHR